MAHFTGTVRCVNISEFAGFTSLEDGFGNTETFILWFNPGGGSGIPPQLNAFTRVAHSMWVSLLREAHSQNLVVRINHPTASAAVAGVQLGQI